ncbi:MAG: cytochrome b/b6 domain-containing protein [Thiolinea sp.]
MITLMLMLAVATLSGWMQTWDMFWGEDWVEELHETSAELGMILVTVHVAAVVIMGRITGIP